jgi:hypothetical protein
MSPHVTIPDEAWAQFQGEAEMSERSAGPKAPPLSTCPCNPMTEHYCDYDEVRTRLAAAEEERGQAVAQVKKELRSEMAVEFDDERLGYVTVQINRDAWEQLNGA